MGMLHLNPKPTQMTKPQFMAIFGGVYELSPWVANIAYEKGLSADDNTAEGLAKTFSKIVDDAVEGLKLQLLRAHPELAGKLALEDKLTEESKSEQAGAGLDRCTPVEFARFQELNSLYREKFGFPFIIAVKGLNRLDILAAFEKRCHHTYEEEFTTALSQVHKIAMMRIRDFA
jgi:2-oxo-4-hydroxy-4-carboxy-5-ureidoimidazoline decarboxylase